MRISTIFYAVKHGEYLVAVEHVLEFFSSSATISVKYRVFQKDLYNFESL